MTYSAGFWDRIAERYSKRPVADEATYQQKLAKTQEYFTKDMEVLEFGCGTGSTAIIHAPYVKRYLATDVSARMIEIAERKLAEHPIDNLSFRQSSIEDLEIEAASLDGVLALNILHLIRDLEDVIDRVHGMLKPGGIFVSSTVCVGDTMPYFKFIGPIGRFLGLMPYVSVVKQQQVIESIKRAGFRLDYELIPEHKVRSCFLVAVKAIATGRPLSS